MVLFPQTGTCLFLCVNGCMIDLKNKPWLALPFFFSVALQIFYIIQSKIPSFWFQLSFLYILMFNRGLWLSMRAIIRYPQREIEKLIIRSTLLLRWYIGNGCCLLSIATRTPQGWRLQKTITLISQLRAYLLLRLFVTITCRTMRR